MIEFQPKIQKIIELLVYLAERRPGCDIYQVVKLFYLADRRHFERFGRPISFDRYFALPYGPVASIAMDLVNGNAYALREAGIKRLPIDITFEHRGNQYEAPVLGMPHREFDRTLFSKSDLSIFDEIIEEYGDKDFDELYNLTHSHLAYKEAWENRREPGTKRAEMFYEEMIEDDARRTQISSDINQVAQRM
ncbi:Panacea domain-containing protein [Notoacmeibacter sp. MSK16QG-6]|uniref:Panacea domain-containing protein n=1 Tax=Notoacmeibacter sp. MSK16QG-6 TaxID=2957982 RepID=UPI00209D4EBC|nr:Panacea domain-containing protein [Notoacmeibacter sp. MSK16QG-6]MCP1199269.1 Panacea domain-containing protein [Notoacmeibacter sp. MSK16QG-6]